MTNLYRPYRGAAYQPNYLSNTLSKGYRDNGNEEAYPSIDLVDYNPISKTTRKTKKDRNAPVPPKGYNPLMVDDSTIPPGFLN